MTLKDIVIDNIKSYRQGIKTVHEIFQEIETRPDLKPFDDSMDLPRQLMEKVGLSAFNCKELFDLPDASATRPGLIHLLSEFLEGRLTAEEITDWADNQITWEVGLEIEDPIVRDIVGGTISFADMEPEKYFTRDIVEGLIRQLTEKTVT